jgi:hypothetical protein
MPPSEPHEVVSSGFRLEHTTKNKKLKVEPRKEGNFGLCPVFARTHRHMPLGHKSESAEQRVNFGETSLWHWSDLEEHSSSRSTPVPSQHGTPPSASPGAFPQGASLHSHESFLVSRTSSLESVGSIRSRLSELSELTPRSPQGSSSERKARSVAVSDCRFAMTAELRPARSPRPPDSIWSASDEDDSADGDVKVDLARKDLSGATDWARKMAERRAEAARRSFSHAVIGAAVRERDAAEKQLVNASSPMLRGSTLAGSDLANSRRSQRAELSPFVRMARNRAETIGDTSAATSLDDSLISHPMKSLHDSREGKVAGSNKRVGAGAPTVSQETMLPRWHARIKHDVCGRTLRSWQAHVQAELLARRNVFRMRWIAWRKVVTALSARRRLAIYVLSSRQRISNAFEIWVALCVRSRICRSLGWLHTEKLLKVCMEGLRSKSNGSKALASVARDTSNAVRAHFLQARLVAWRVSTFVARQAIQNCVKRKRRLTIFAIHAWLCAISGSRARLAVGLWMESGQGERIQCRVMWHWHMLAGATADSRRATLRTGASTNVITYSD